MAQPFIGQIIQVGFNFAPRGWAMCNGQLMSIAQNTALFSLLGTTYGGNGVQNFALPDFRSRAPLHQGQGPGLSDYIIGEASGTESVSLLYTEMPQHTHLVGCQTATGSVPVASGNFPAGNQVNRDTGIAVDTSYDPTANGTMNPMTIGAAGGSQPHTNMQPYLCVTFIIALEGIFPSRN